MEGISAVRNLEKLLMPVPSMIEEALGYMGSSRFVAFYWEPVPLGFCWHDPHHSKTSPHWAVWFAFTQHRRVHPFLEPYLFGSEGTAAKHWLLLDRVERVFFVGLAAHVNAFLGTVRNEFLSSECEVSEVGDSAVIQAALCAMVADWLDGKIA